MNPPIPPRLTKVQPCQGIECRIKGLDTTRYSYKLGGQGSYGFDVLLPQDMDINETDMSVFIPICDGNRRDGVGDLLEVSGINCERHRTNPLVLFDHGKQVTLPIALAETRDTKLYTFAIDPVARTAGLRAFFYQGRGGDTLTTSEYGKQYDHALYCEQLFDMVAKKMLRAGSIGYQVIEADQMPADYATGTPQGLHLKRILMLEGSLVVLPANMDTVGKMLCDGKCCGKSLSPYLVKSLTPYKPEKVAQMNVPGHGHKDCHCGGSCGKCKEEKSMEVQTKASVGNKESYRVKQGFDGKWYVVESPNRTDTELGPFDSQAEAQRELDNQFGKSLPNREQLTTNQTAVPYTPPPKTGPARPMQAELGDAMISNPQNLLVSDGPNPGPTAANFSWAKVKRLRKSIRMKRGTKTITGIKSQPSDKIDPKKAEQILKDGTANGEPLTDKQRGMFGAAVGRDKKAMSAIRAGAGAELVGVKGVCPDCKQDPCICPREGENWSKKLKGRTKDFALVAENRGGKWYVTRDRNIIAGPFGEQEAYDWIASHPNGKNLNGHKNGLSPLTPVPKVHAAQRSYYDRVLNAAADDDVNAGNLKALRMKYRKKGMGNYDWDRMNEVERVNALLGADSFLDGREARMLAKLSWEELPGDHKRKLGMRATPIGKSLSCSSCGKSLPKKIKVNVRLRPSDETAIYQAARNTSIEWGRPIPTPVNGEMLTWAVLSGPEEEVNELKNRFGKSLPGHETKGWGNWLNAIAAVLATLIGDPGLANINLELMGDDLGLDDLYGEGKTPQQAAEAIKPKVRKKMLEVKTKAVDGWAVMVDGRTVLRTADENKARVFAKEQSKENPDSEVEVVAIKNTKSIDAVMFDAWGTENYNTPLENRKINVRENGSEREITFGQLISMVGHGEAERLWRMAIRKGTGKWHAASESYSPNAREYAGKSGKVPGNPLTGKFGSFIEQWEAMSPAERLPLLQGAGLSTGLANRDWTGMDRVEQATLLRTHAKGTKSLPDIRMKYRAVKKYRKTLRRAKAGSASFAIHEKDLDSVKADAKAAGCKASWSGGDGSSIRVKLTGSDEAIDGIARKFARRGR